MKNYLTTRHSSHVTVVKDVKVKKMKTKKSFFLVVISFTASNKDWMTQENSIMVRVNDEYCWLNRCMIIMFSRALIFLLP